MAPKNKSKKSRAGKAMTTTGQTVAEETSSSVGFIKTTESTSAAPDSAQEGDTGNTLNNVESRRRAAENEGSSSIPSAQTSKTTTHSSTKTDEDVVSAGHEPSTSTEEEKAPGDSTVAPPPVVDVPSDIPVASTRESMSTLIKDVERLASGRDDATSLRAKIKKSIQPMIDGIMQMHEHEVRSLRATITTLEQKRQEEAARSLLVTSFENSLDRVSEGQVKAEVEALNGSIEDFAADITENVFETPADLSVLVEARKSGRSALLTTSSYLRLDDDENRGYLIEALVHKNLVERLHHLFFEGDVAVNNKLSEATEEMYETVVLKEETWKVAQRWRAITSNVFNCQMESSVIDSSIAKTAKLIAKDVSLASGRLSSALPSLEDDILKRLPALYKEARTVASSARRDHVSSQLKISITPSKQDMPIIDTACVEIQWAGIAAPEKNDRVLGTYGFGLLKIEEGGLPVVVLRPKVITESLERLDPDHSRREAKKAEAKQAKEATAAAKKAAKRAAKGANPLEDANLGEEEVDEAQGKDDDSDPERPKEATSLFGRLSFPWTS